LTFKLISMGTPKQRQTKSRRDKRRANFSLKKINLSKCPCFGKTFKKREKNKSERRASESKTRGNSKEERGKEAVKHGRAV